MDLLLDGLAEAALAAVCRWRGDSAARIARLITDRATSGPRADDSTHHHPGAAVSPKGEGASAR
ncbi:hypothetical protein [Streptomyces sp. CA2R106]|uniref:hypothetical protein n=1 Tax=Streptomyces sp. CA2R106 TaxID=3120153 RepID=UPI0030092F11